MKASCALSQAGEGRGGGGCTVPVGDPVGGVLRAHSVSVTACDSAGGGGYGGLRTAITASPAHPLHTVSLSPVPPPLTPPGPASVSSRVL